MALLFFYRRGALMALPNFFCVGTQKAATTTLHDILKQHPNIYLPPSKEPWFFHRDEKYRKGLAWYENEYFSGYNNEKTVGEITPEYMYFEKVPGRIFKELGPDILFLFVLRNPVDRAYSHYLMTCRRGFETLSFEKAVKFEHARINSGFKEKIHYSYLSRGKYCEQIERYVNFFPKKNMMFLIFEEDIVLNIEKSINRILLFLDVEEIKLDCNIQSNPATMPKIKLFRDLIYTPNFLRRIMKLFVPSSDLRSKIRNMLDMLNQRPHQSPKLDTVIRRQILEKYFQEDIKRLEEIIQRDLTCWYA